MALDMDMTALTEEQGRRARKLFSAVVLAALDDAILDERKHGTGVSGIATWARSKDGRIVLHSAGIDPNERTIKGMMAFVERGIKSTAA
ncbi:MAG: DUF6280 family protein [Pseudomonadota bacterium]